MAERREGRSLGKVVEQRGDPGPIQGTDLGEGHVPFEEQLAGGARGGPGAGTSKGPEGGRGRGTTGTPEIKPTSPESTDEIRDIAAKAQPGPPDEEQGESTGGKEIGMPPGSIGQGQKTRQGPPT